MKKLMFFLAINSFSFCFEFSLLEELGLYLKKTVPEDSNQQQTPYHYRFIKSDDGDFIFFKEQ